MNITEQTYKLFDQAAQQGIQLQRHYFDNERFFDHINGCGAMDNASNWTTDLWFCLKDAEKGKITEDKLRDELRWTYECFDELAYKMECHGAGQNGAARGINHNTQYTWALARHAANLIDEMATGIGIKFLHNKKAIAFS